MRMRNYALLLFSLAIFPALLPRQQRVSKVKFSYRESFALSLARANPFVPLKIINFCV
jgi:hypothetical protein